MLLEKLAALQKIRDLEEEAKVAKLAKVPERKKKGI